MTQGINAEHVKAAYWEGWVDSRADDEYTDFDDGWQHSSIKDVVDELAAFIAANDELATMRAARDRAEAHHLALFMRATEAEAMCKRLADALEQLHACPMISDVDHNDPDWGCGESAEAESVARAALAAYRDRKRALSTLEAIP